VRAELVREETRERAVKSPAEKTAARRITRTRS